MKDCKYSRRYPVIRLNSFNIPGMEKNNIIADTFNNEWIRQV